MAKKGEYPHDWGTTAFMVKEAADWKCTKCGHVHDPAVGYTLTVHHIDGNKANSAPDNIQALCQRCHLRLQRQTTAIKYGQLSLLPPRSANLTDRNI